MFGIDLVSLVVGIAVGATFPMFFKGLWNTIKVSPIYVKFIGFFGGGSSTSTPAPSTPSADQAAVDRATQLAIHNAITPTNTPVK